MTKESQSHKSVQGARDQNSLMMKLFMLTQMRMAAVPPAVGVPLMMIHPMTQILMKVQMKMTKRMKTVTKAQSSPSKIEMTVNQMMTIR